MRSYKLRSEATRRAIEDRIIREIKEKNKFLESEHKYRVNSKRKKQLRAEANTIPLEAFGFIK